MCKFQRDGTTDTALTCVRNYLFREIGHLGNNVSFVYDTEALRIGRVERLVRRFGANEIEITEGTY